MLLILTHDMLIPGFPVGCLVQASESHCPCLALDNLTKTQQGGVPCNYVGGSFILQRLNLPQVSYLDVPVLSCSPCLIGLGSEGVSGSWPEWFNKLALGVVSVA